MNFPGNVVRACVAGVQIDSRGNDDFSDKISRRCEVGNGVRRKDEKIGEKRGKNREGRRKGNGGKGKKGKGKTLKTHAVSVTGLGVFKC